MQKINFSNQNFKTFFSTFFVQFLRKKLEKCIATTFAKAVLAHVVQQNPHRNPLRLRISDAFRLENSTFTNCYLRVAKDLSPSCEDKKAAQKSDRQPNYGGLKIES